jgi:hypothetical protein
MAKVRKFPLPPSGQEQVASNSTVNHAEPARRLANDHSPSNSLLRILLVTEAKVDRTHGTGVQLIRIFSKNEGFFILHVTPEGHEGDAFQSIVIKRAFEKNLASKLVTRAWRMFLRDILRHGANWRPNYVSTSIMPAIASFNPDLVLGVVYTNDGLRLLERVMKAVRGKPAVLWFQDLQLVTDKHGRVPDLEKLLGLVSEVWTLSPLMTEQLAGCVGQWPESVGVRYRPHWCMHVSDQYYPPARGFSERFKCIMLGNIWNPEMVLVTKQLWRECQSNLPGLAPIQWICHQAGVLRIKNLGIELGPEIEWAGEVPEEDLQETIRESDLAIIPVSVKMPSDYERYSVPSKIGELAAIGIPMIIISGSMSATTRYANDFAVGEVFTELRQDLWSARLCEIINSIGERARLSALARNYAERCLDQDQFRSEVFAELKRVAKIQD